MASSDLFPFTQPSSSGDEAPDPAALTSFLERMPRNKPSLEVRKRAILVGDPAVRRSAPSQFPAPLPISGHQNSPFVVRLAQFPGRLPLPFSPGASRCPATGSSRFVGSVLFLLHGRGRAPQRFGLSPPRETSCSRTYLRPRRSGQPTFRKARRGSSSRYTGL